MKAEQKTITFNRKAWAKIKWFMSKAKKQEISGFGITGEDDPFNVIDFQTIGQKGTTATTGFDDVALAKYVGENMKKGIEPSRCMRVWVHSHPFATGVPTPSSIDYNTLETKFMNESDWAIMIIMGKTGAFAELRARTKMPGEPVVIVPLSIEIPWMEEEWEEGQAHWTQEFKENVKEEIEQKTQEQYKTHTGKKFISTVFPLQRKTKSEDGMVWQSGEMKQYYEEWLQADTEVSLFEFQTARAEGFKITEICRWGTAVTRFTPDQLRKAERTYHQKQKTKYHKNKKSNKKRAQRSCI